MQPTILTNNATYFHFHKPDQYNFTIEVIASSLSKICRFTGHTRYFYSVAQHSTYISHLVPPQFALHGLLHDAAEAFLGDVSAPLKQLLPDYKRLESMIERVIFQRFGLPEVIPPAIKYADLIMLATERRDLLPTLEADPVSWAHDEMGIRPAEFFIMPRAPEQAERIFLKRYRELTTVTTA